MVLSWNAEPSPGINGTTPLPVLSRPFPKNQKFLEAPRFARDGTNHPDRSPNFLNGHDAQNSELAPVRVEVDTNTHTTYADRLASAKAVLEMAEAVELSLWSLPAFKSNRAKSATTRSLLRNDPRFECLRDNYPEPLGPGDYWIQGGSPDLGPLPAYQPSRTSSPARDPLRISAAFTSPERGRLFPVVESPDRVYIDAEFTPGQDKTVPWYLSKDQRPSIPDYRYSLRHSEARREVPKDEDYSSSTKMDMACKPLKISEQAVHGAATRVAFSSKEPRLLVLPNRRDNDIRLARPCQSKDEEVPLLGPGSYTPPISLGGAKRKTYRLFSSPEPPGILGYGASPTARSSSYLMKTAFGQSIPGAPSYRSGGLGSSGLLRHALGPPTSSFQNTPRGRKHGPFNWATDSSQTRTL